MENMIGKIAALFKEAHYETLIFNQSEKIRNRFSFDLLVKKDNTLYTVKVFKNIDNINEDTIKEVKTLSKLLNSRPILIGIKNRYQKLNDNTIYIRYDLPFITFNTLKQVIQAQVFPEILARRGGGVIFLDGNVMKTLREQKKVSRKEMSEELGVTKRTICAYENENMRPSEEIAAKIMDILEDGSLFRKINVLEWNLKFTLDPKELYQIEDLTDFESHLQDIFKDLGLSSYWSKKGVVPFKLSLFTGIKDGQRDVYPVFSDITDENQKINKQQLEALSVFTNMLAKNAILIVDNTIRVPDSLIKNRISVIRVKKLEKIDSEEEFIAHIQDPES